MGKRISLMAALVILMVGGVLADRIETVDETFQFEDAESVQVECDFAAGQLWITAADMDELAKIEVTYEPRYVDYKFDYRVKHGVGRLMLESDLKRTHHNDNLENEWMVKLSRKLPMELLVDVGACEADIDLGGIPLTEAEFDIGAASGRIEFSEPNPRRMEKLSFDVGASSVDLVRLGNANFDYMDFDGGAGACEMDFRGEYHGESVVNIDIGAGSADIVVPKGLPVQIEADKDGWFSSVDFGNLDLEKVGRNLWETPDFEGARDRLVLRVDVAMGSVDIYAR